MGEWGERRNGEKWRKTEKMGNWGWGWRYLPSQKKNIITKPDLQSNKYFSIYVCHSN